MAKLNKAAAKERAAKNALKKAELKKKAVKAAEIKSKRGKEAQAKKKKSAEADRKYAVQKAEVKVKTGKAKRAQGRERSSKKAAEKASKAEKAQSAAQNKADAAIKECAIDGSECLNKKGQCKKITSKGPFMCSDLTTCCKKKPKEDANAGLAWAGFGKNDFPEAVFHEPPFTMPKMPGHMPPIEAGPKNLHEVDQLIQDGGVLSKKMKKMFGNKVKAAHTKQIAANKAAMMKKAAAA